MSNYNKATNFAVKDTLTSGDPDKVVSGAEIDNEFNSIASAVTSKADKVSGSTTDNFAALDANGNLKDSGESAFSVGSPTGSVISFAGSSAPSGWILCSGQNENRATYPDLFNVIGETFGAGDGSTTFGIPDLRGEFVRGWDNGRGVDSGRNFGSSQLDALQQMEGSFIPGDNPDPTGVFESGGSVTASTGIPEGSTDKQVNFDASLVARTADETRPRNIALMYIIKT